MKTLEMNLVGFNRKNEPVRFQDLATEEEGPQKRREWLMCVWEDDTWVGPLKVWLPGQRGATYLTPELHAKFLIWACNGDSNKRFLLTDQKPEPAHMCWLNGKEVIVPPEYLLPLKGSIKAKK